MEHIFHTINSSPELKKNRFKILAAANSVDKITYLSKNILECLSDKKINTVNYNYYYDLATADIVKISSKAIKNWLEFDSHNTNPMDMVILDYNSFLEDFKNSQLFISSSSKGLSLKSFLLSIEEKIKFLENDKSGIASYYSHIFNRIDFELSTVNFNKKIFFILKHHYKELDKNHITIKEEDNSYIKRLKNIVSGVNHKSDSSRYNNQSQQIHTQIVTSNITLSPEELQLIEKIGKTIIKMETFSNYCNEEMLLSLNKMDQLLTLQLQSILLSLDIKEMNVILSLTAFISSIDAQIDNKCQIHINNLLSLQSQQTLDNIKRFKYSF